MLTLVRSLILQVIRACLPAARIRHEGAVEGWSPAAEVAGVDDKPTAEPAPDWDTNVWTVDVHGTLNALEDAFRADVEYIWGRFYDWLGMDARTRMELAGVGV